MDMSFSPELEPFRQEVRSFFATDYPQDILDKVRKGQKISRVGSTGSVVTPQLHFELRKNRRARNPSRYLSRV